MESREMTVFLGDSITYGGDWAELLGREDVVNKGISGDTTRDVWNRIDDVALIKARRYFIMIGVNDLAHGFSVDEIVDNHRRIIERLRQSNPGAFYCLQSVLPVNDRMRGFGFSNQTVRELNRRLAEMQSTVDRSRFIDLYPNFLDGHGKLDRAYTQDGLHLNDAGYRVWAGQIAGFLE